MEVDQLITILKCQHIMAKVAGHSESSLALERLIEELRVHRASPTTKQDQGRGTEASSFLSIS